MQASIQSVLDQADLAYQMGHCDQAVDQILKAIQERRSERELYLKLAEILLDSEQFQDALKLLSDAPPDATDDYAIALIGCCHEALGNCPAAGIAAENALSLNSKSGLAVTLKGRIAARSGDMVLAEYYYRMAISSDAFCGEAYLGLGLLKWEQGSPADAMDMLEEGFLRAPTVKGLAIRYHAAAAALHEFDRAEESFRRALKDHQHNQRLRFLFIDLLLRKEKLKEAMSEIEAAMVNFGIDDGILSAALDVRKRLGLLSVDAVVKEQRRVSLCMIVKNEEKQLARCLLSAQPVVDEIIVVDTGSKDRSKDIAAAFGAEVFDFSWTSDFSEARNFSLSQASGDWILVLDADEMISAKNYNELRSIVQIPSDKPAAYCIRTRNYTHHSNTIGWTPNKGDYSEEEGTGWFPSDKVRLFTNDARIRFVNAVHELIEPCLRDLNIPICSCNIPVHHFGKLQEAKTHEKTKVYRDLGKKKLKKNRRNPSAVRELAIQSAHLGKHADALNLWRQFLKLQPISAEAHLNIGTACWNLARYAEAADFAEKALRLDPTLKEAKFNRAIALLLLGRADETKSILQEVVAKQPEYPAAQFLLCVAHVCLGEQSQIESALNTLIPLPMGGYIGESFLDIARRLLSASLADYARLTLKAASRLGYVHSEIVLLLERCRSAAA
jgi:tetratricopeptide (TPR) repeat protein